MEITSKVADQQCYSIIIEEKARTSDKIQEKKQIQIYLFSPLIMVIQQ